MQKVNVKKDKREGNETKGIAIIDNHKKIIFTILAILLIAIFCISITPVTFQNDTYYTIKIGEQITKTGIDNQDHFSWHQDLAYTYPHWLYDLLTYFIYSFSGFTGIYVTTCILSAILGISIFLVNRKITKSQIISFILTVLVMYMIKSYIAARAQLVTFILFVWIIYFIEMFLKDGKKRYAIGLILISTLIANLHVAVWPFIFVLFLPYIAEYIIASLGEWIIYRKTKRTLIKLQISILEKRNPAKAEVLKQKLIELDEQISRIKIKRTKELENPYKLKLVKNNHVKGLILIMIICAFTGLLTPLGDTPYTYLYKTMQGNTTENINEHLPMTLIDEEDVLSAIVIFLAILTFSKTKIRLSDLFMISGLCYLMISSRRQVTMFAIIGVIVLNRLICNLIEIYYGKDKLQQLFQKFANKFVYVIMLVVMLFASYHFAEEKKNDSYVDESTYPVQACDYILQNIDLGKARFYNEYNYGSYMMYRGIPVFIDSRADLYAPEFSGKQEDIFMDFIEVSSIAQFYEDVFEKYDITHVITYENSKISMIIDKTKDPNYKKLYKDNHFVIYERLNV